MRVIDADALEKRMEERLNSLRKEFGNYDHYTDGFEEGMVAVEDAPTIDPEELRPKGEWVGEADGYADGELVYDVWYCSECNHCIDDGTDDPELLPNYCPNCGADMRGTPCE